MHKIYFRSVSFLWFCLHMRCDIPYLEIRLLLFTKIEKRYPKKSKDKMARKCKYIKCLTPQMLGLQKTGKESRNKLQSLVSWAMLYRNWQQLVSIMFFGAFFFQAHNILRRMLGKEFQSSISFNDSVSIRFVKSKNWTFLELWNETSFNWRKTFLMLWSLIFILFNIVSKLKWIRSSMKSDLRIL